MKSRFLSTAIAMIMLLSTAAAFATAALPAPPALADGAEWHVDAGGGQDFTSIQDAIDAAMDGDTIIVHDGEYNGSISIDKSLTILSQNGSALTTINVDDGTYSYSAVQIECGGVTFGAEGQGFTMAGNYYSEGDYLGIIAETYPGQTFYGITIAGNEVYGFYYGINLYNWDGGDINGCAITGNEVHDCYDGITLDSDLGLNHDNTVSGNEVYYCDYGIHLATYDEGSYVYGNTVEDNDIYDCDYCIIMESDGGGDVYENTIDGNEIYDCYTGIGLGSFPDGYTTASTYDNTVMGNTIHDCYDEGLGFGVKLYADGEYGYAYLYGNNIDGNDVYDCDSGIVLWSVYDAEMYDNTLTGNTVYCDAYENGEDGIFLYTDYDGDIEDCTVQGNTVYGWEYGIELYDESVTTIEYIDILDNILYSGTTGNGEGISIYRCYEITVSGNNISYSEIAGIYVYESYNIYVTGNSVHDSYCTSDSAGIYIDLSDYVYIYGNDIRDNYTYYGGIYIHGPYDVTANCNNLVDNWCFYWGAPQRLGVWADTDEEHEVNAEYNWWGGESGYEYGGYYGYLDAWPYLYEELTLLPDAIIDYASVPAAVSLYDTLFGENYEVYSMGPDYTDIIVEFECPEENPCEIQYATVDLASLLLDILPADFEECYVAEWSEDGQDYWDDWLDYLSDIEMDYYSTGDICFFDYEFQLEDLIWEDHEGLYDECIDYECVYSCTDECLSWECLDTCETCEGCCFEYFGLDTFLEIEYGFYNEEYEGCDDYEADMRLGTLLFEQLRLGQHVVPVTVYSSCSWYTVYVPLAVVDFQLPLEIGWNLRSTPVTLDASYNTFGEIIGLGDGMPGIEALITYNAETGLWEEPGLDAVMAPLSAYYIKMSQKDQMGFVVNRNPTMPPSRQLCEGWNLVSLAAPFQYSPDEYYEDWPYYLHPFRAMTPWDALYSARITSGGDPGWILAMNPPENLDYDEYFYYKDVELEKDYYYKYFYQEPWLAFSDYDWSGGVPFLTPGGGYWVFVENAAVLTGYSYTPYPWVIWWD